MNCLILSSFLFTVALGAPQGYSLPAPSNPLQPSNGGQGGFDGRFDSGFGGGFGGINGGNSNGGIINNIGGSSISDAPCQDEQVRNVNGICVTPEITRNVFVYAAPENAVNLGPAPELPQPKVEYNIVFVRTPEFIEGADPIVIPPPQKKTLVYVLSKKQILGGQQIIEVPSGSVQNPEVFYVNYRDGENPELPGGINLQDALNAADESGLSSQVIGGDFTEIVAFDRGTDSVEESPVTDIGVVNGADIGVVNGANIGFVNGGFNSVVGGGFTNNPFLNRPSRPSNLYSSP